MSDVGPTGNRFYVQLQEGSTPDVTASRVMQELIRLTAQLNAAQLPIVVGPEQDLPEGMIAGQPVINWTTGTPSLQVFDGNELQTAT